MLPGALLSAVNLAEIVSKLAERGMPAGEAQADALALGCKVVPFGADLAQLAGELRPLTRTAGLSLGDRYCLALARQRDAVALTTEARWVDAGAAIGVRVRNIRPGADPR